MTKPPFKARVVYTIPLKPDPKPDPKPYGIEELTVDLITHQADFKDAFESMRDRALIEADRLYWQHQLDVHAKMVQAAQNYRSDHER